MPAEHPPPQGELPFGPRNLSLYYVDFGTRIVRPGEPLGYQFGAKAAGHRVLHLHWIVSARLRRVDRNGKVLSSVESVRRRLVEVDDLDRLELAFAGRRPGLYRFDTEFRNLSGRKLGSYHEYFRVVRRKVGLKLALGRSTFRPGETVYVQARNFGTDDATVPQQLPLEKKTGSEWVPVGRQTASITESAPWWLGIGEAAPCSKFAIPADAQPGAYRFRVSARVRGAHRPRVLVANFAVSAARQAP